MTTTSNNYFDIIDTEEKAYLLGLTYKQPINKPINISNQKIIKILQDAQITTFNTNPYTIYINNTNFNNNAAILDFPNFSNDFKLLFIRGIYENNDNTNFIEITDNIKPIFDIIKNDLIINYDIINDNLIFINNIKNFINKIYSINNDLTIFDFLKLNNIKNIICYNDKPTIKVYKTCDEAIIPSKAFEEDAGYDLTIINKIKDFNSKTSLYDTGIKIEIDEGYYTEIVPRSSISKFGYMLANSVGIIDNNYRGNLMIALTKICDDAPEIEFPFKCCQLIIRKQISANLYEVTTTDNLTSTNRNEGGFGSTS
jgi:dUTP pyrophosphatase